MNLGWKNAFSKLTRLGWEFVVFRRKGAKSLFLGMLFCLFPMAVNAEPIRLGALLHLTGEFAVQGVAFREGVELALSEVNSDGRYEMLFEDTKYLPLETSTGAKRLAQAGARAVLVSTLTEVKTASPILTPREIPMLVLWDSSPELEQLSEYIFSLGPWTPSAGELPATFARTWLNARRAVIVNSNTEWSLSTGEYFKAKFEALGGEVLKVFTFNPGEPDFMSALTRTRAIRPDLIFAPMDSMIPQFFTQVKRLSLPMPVVTAQIITEDNLEESPEAFQGVYQSQVAPPEGERFAEMLKSYEKKFGQKARQPLYVAWAYDAILLLDSVLRNEPLRGEALRARLLATHGFRGASGEVSFAGHRSAPKNEEMFRIEGQSFQKVGKEK